MVHNKVTKWIIAHKKTVALIAAALLVTAFLTGFVLSGASGDFLKLAGSKLGLEGPSEARVSETFPKDDPTITTKKGSDSTEPTASGSVAESDSSVTTQSEPTETSASDSSIPSTDLTASAAPTTASSLTAATTKKPTTPASPTTKSSSPTTTTTAPTTTTSINMGDFSGSFDSGKAEAVLALVNEARAAQEDPLLSPLTWSSTLVTSAKLRAPEIVVKWSHTRPDGSSWTTAFSSNPGSIGENIAYGQTSAQSVFDDWMASAGHRANIMDSGFTKMGIACYYCNGTYYWVQHFSS